jgi:hypothetical protein
MTLSSWRRKQKQSPNPRRGLWRRFLPVLEVLEDRLVPAAPLVGTAAATAVTTTQATLNGTVNPEGSTATARFQYSTDPTFTPTVATTIGSGFSNPTGVAVDAAGDVFVTDPMNNTLKEVLPDGTIRTLGSGLSNEAGVAVDAAGDVFVTEPFNNAVKEVLPNGTIVTLGSGFSHPAGVAVDAAGDVFIADANNNAVKEVLPSGAIQTIGSGFSYPYDVAVDAAGDVFVADYGNNAVKEVLPSGAIRTLASGLLPFNVAVDAAGDVLVPEYWSSYVNEVLPDGTIRTLASGFSYPFGVAVDAAGDIFVADNGNNRVVELSPPTVAATPAPLTGSQATAVSASLTGLSPGTTYYYRVVASSPAGIVADSSVQSFTTQQVATSFANLTGGSIPFGASSVPLSGQLATTPGTPFASGSVVTVSINGVAETAALNPDGSFQLDYQFSAALHNFPLGVAQSPYAITYAYADPSGTFAPTSDSSQALTITQASPTVTWANPAPIFYGTALSATQLDATANVPGTFSYTLADGVTPADGAVLGVGPGQILNVTFTPADTADYNTASAQVLINVVIPETLTVNSVADTTTADNSLTLREAVLLADAGGDATAALGRPLTAGEAAQITPTSGSNDTIVFDPGLAGQTITLSLMGDDTVGPSALPVTTALSIDGPSGGSGVTLSGGGAGSDLRLFYVSPSGNLTLQDLTLSNGRAPGGNGASQEGAGGGGAGLGGAIFNRGTLTVQNSTLSGNMAVGGNAGNSGGGGIGGGGGGLGANARGQSAGSPGGGSGGYHHQAGSPGGFGGGGGGGGYSSGGAAGGSGGFGGGGGGSGGYDRFYPAAPGGFGGGAGGVTYFGGGSAGGGGAGLGGAIFNEGGTVTITNSTLSGNLAQGGLAGARNGVAAGNGQGLGGAVFNHNGTLTPLNCTLSGNTAAQGGRGVYNLGDGRGQTATAIINNTIIGQADTSVSDFVGQTINGGASTTSGSGDLIRTQSGFNGTIVSTADPLLQATLTDNGGPTLTLLPQAGSPAIDAGDNAAAAGLLTDQRVFGPRVVNGTVDIGAVEVKETPIITWANPAAILYGTPLSATQLDATANVHGTFSYTLADGVTPADGAVLNGGLGQILNVTFTPTDTADYNTATAQVLITVIAPMTLTVNSVADNTTADNSMTLREAVLLADADGNAKAALGRTLTAGEAAQITHTSGGTDTILFDPGLAGQTITLSVTGDDTVGPSALPVTTALNIDGPSSGSGVTLSGGGAGWNLRLFYVSAAGNLTLQDLTLSNARAPGGNGASQGGAGGGGAGLGGAIFNRGTLTVQNSTLSGNMAVGGNGGNGGQGGGIGGGGGGIGANASGQNGGSPGGGNGGSSNYNYYERLGSPGGFGGGGGGGGYYSDGAAGGPGGFGGGGGGSGDYARYANAAPGGFGGGAGGVTYFGGGAGGGGAGLGGAIFNEGGIVTITNSTLSGNLAQGGLAGVTPSGFYNQAAGNGQGLGGAVFNHNGTLTLLDSTLSGNTAAQGGRGVYSLGDGSGQTATAIIDNTIIGQADTSVSDFVGQTINGGASTTSGSGDLIRTQSGFSGTIASTADPLLQATLTDNGGPTLTLLPQAGSPAIDAGDNAAAAGLPTDQRSFGPRVVNGTVDIGAVEVGAKGTPTVAVSDAGGTYSGSPFPATATVNGGPSLEGVSPTLAYYAGTYTDPSQLAGLTALSGAPTAAGSYTVLASFAGSADYTAASATATFTINPPTASVSGPTVGVPGQPLTYTVAVNGPTQGISFNINYGDGTSLQTGAGGPSIQLDHLYTAPGTFTIRVTATDQKGVVSTLATQAVHVSTVALEPDPSGGTALAIGGSAAGHDTITVTGANTAGTAVKVKVNRSAFGPYTPTGHIFVYGQGGNDLITLSPYVVGTAKYYIQVPAFLYGEGSGGDRISAAGSAANNVLTGHGTNETLTGGHGRDLLIGGTGVATLHAGTQDDILIGGWTNYDIGSAGMTYGQKLAALEAVMAEWGSADPYATRLSALAGSLNPTTVHDNYQGGAPVADVLAGNLLAGDWFFAGLNDKVTGKNKKDVLTRIQ